MPTYRKRNGQWQVQVRLKGHQPASKTFTHKEDAKRWGEEMERTIKLHGLPKSRKELEPITLQQLVERYCEVCLPLKRSGKNERVILNGFLKREPSLARKSLAVVSRSDFAAYRDRRLAQDKVKPSTLRRELNPLRHMFRTARNEWDLPVESPFNGLKLPAEGPGRDRRLKEAEYVRLKRCLHRLRNREKAQQWIAIFDLVLSTGMRRGEILALKWGDIDLENRTIHIRYSKNGRSRLLPMSFLTRKTLYFLGGSESKDITTHNRDPESRVISLTVTGFEQAWTRLRAWAEIKGLTFHDLRHEAACRLHEIGLTTHETKYMIGHHSRDVTSRYIHPDLERIRAKLDEHAYIQFDTASQRDNLAMPSKGDERTMLESYAHRIVRLRKRFGKVLPGKEDPRWNDFHPADRLALLLFVRKDRTTLMSTIDGHVKKILETKAAA